MKIIFMGTPDFASVILEALTGAGHEVVLAVTQPDKPKGRGKAVQFPPVKQTALAHNIEVFQPQRIRRPENVARLAGYSPDIIIVAAFGQILPAQVLELPPYGCVNVHASLLPRYRGSSPVQWAIINGDAKSGVTTMQMDEGIDTGDMLEKSEVILAPDETGGSLFDKLAQAGAKLCLSTIARIENGTITRTAQNEAEATYVGMITKQMGQIDWEKPAVETERLIRGLNPWPGTYTRLGEKTLKIWKAAVVPEAEERGVRMAEAGTIVLADKKRLFVRTGQGLLSLLEVQLEGKKRMDVGAFLRGFPVEEGTRLATDAGQRKI